MRKYAATPILTGLAFLAAGPLSSSDAKAQSVADSPDQITEIVVTAQKREQRVQDIPISVSAISGDEIERAGARDFHDLLLSIPGVSYSGAEPGQSRYSIHGLSPAASRAPQ